MRHPSVVPILATTLLSVALVRPNPVSAQTPQTQSHLTTEHWLDWERAGDPRISPDGLRVVYARGWVDKMNDTWESAIWIVNADGSRNRHLIDGSSARWAPDGSRIAFLAPDQNGTSQIFIRWMDAEGAVSQVTRLQQPPTDITWSPDGTQLAFRLRVAAAPSAEWGIDLPRPEGATWTSSPRIVGGGEAAVGVDAAPERLSSGSFEGDPGAQHVALGLAADQA